MRFKLIMALVDDHHVDILNAVRKAGATGATVVTSAHSVEITRRKHSLNSRSLGTATL